MTAKCVSWLAVVLTIVSLASVVSAQSYTPIFLGPVTEGRSLDSFGNAVGGAWGHPAGFQIQSNQFGISFNQIQLDDAPGWPAQTTSCVGGLHPSTRNMGGSAYALNDNGTAAGSWRRCESFQAPFHAEYEQGFVQGNFGPNGTFARRSINYGNSGGLGGLRDTTLRDINASNKAVGWSYEQWTVQSAPWLFEYEDADAFIYDAPTDTITPIPTPGQRTYAHAINEPGLVAGSWGPEAGLARYFGTHAFIYTPGQGGTGQRKDLGDFGETGFYHYSDAFDLNDSGMAVGESARPDGTTHAFLYNGSGIADLALGQSTYSYTSAKAINNSGQIVGMAITPDYTRKAVMYAGGNVLDLAAMVPADSLYSLSEATDINDDGVILANGCLFMNYCGGFALIPDALAAPGGSQSTAILPPSPTPGAFQFTSARSGLWFDPPMASGFGYEMDSDSLFAEILAFPEGFSGLSVIVEGVALAGTFGTGPDDQHALDFLALLGEGVSSFSIEGILPRVHAENSGAFPLKLAFSTETADFTMTALDVTHVPYIPEPAGVIPLAVLAATLRARHRRSPLSAAP